MKSIDGAIHKSLVFVLLAGLGLQGLHAQDKKLAIKSMVDSSQFVFHAQTAIPTQGPTRQLTSEYDFSISRDVVISHLPYFGRAYSVTYGSADGGYNFTSKEFEYKSTARKKGGWQISIKPRDVPDFREFLLTVSENGYGTLQVASNNRQPISFTGYISELKSGKRR